MYLVLRYNVDIAVIETSLVVGWVCVQERLLASMLTHQLVADMKRDSACKRLPLAVCASRNGGPQTYDCARSLLIFHLRPAPWKADKTASAVFNCR